METKTPKFSNGPTLPWRKMENMGQLSIGDYEGDAGLDMTTSKKTHIPPFCFAKIPCGIRIALPEGMAAIVMARSSAVSNKHLLVYPTLIEQYRGDLFVFAYNLSNIPIVIEPGERVAQLLPVPVLANNLVLVEVNELPASERGNNGFGSTGK